MPRACWGSQTMSGRSQRRSSRSTLQFQRPKHPGSSSDRSTQRKSLKQAVPTALFGTHLIASPASADQRSVDAAFMPGSLRRQRRRSPGRCCPRRGRSWPGGPSRGGSSRRSSARGRAHGRCAGPPAGSGRRRRPRRGAAACPSRADWESQRILICDQADNGVTRFDMIKNTKTGSLEAECNPVTDQHCSPRAVRTPVGTRNPNPDVARSVAT